MATSLRALHCSDLHLHEVQFEHGVETVGMIAAAARCQRADVVLLAGDVFDAATQPTAFVARIAEELAAVAVPLIAIPGNHDIAYSPSDGDAIGDLFAALGDSSTLLRADEGGSALVADGRIRVWGRGMPEHTRANDPLDGLPAMPLDGAWNIALAHGELTRSLSSPFGSPIILDRYAEVLGNVHYLALGHHHVPAAQAFGATAVQYSGSASTVVGAGTVAVVDFDGEHAISAIHGLSDLADC